MAEKKTTGMTRGVKGSTQTNQDLADIEQRMMKVKRAFEMYFNGLEKAPPLVEYEQLKRAVRAMTGTGFATATLRFKVQSTIARFNQYRNLWDRQLKRFEEGTFKPGVGAAPGRSTANRIRGGGARGSAGRRGGSDDF